MDVTKNNWLLPLRGESFDRHPDVAWVQGMGLRALVQQQSTPIFNQLNRTHWQFYFTGFNRRRLLEMCRDLGLPASKSTTQAVMINRLCAHWHTILSEA